MNHSTRAIVAPFLRSGIRLRGKILDLEPLLRRRERVPSGSQPGEKRFVSMANDGRVRGGGSVLQCRPRGGARRRDEKTSEQRECDRASLQNSPHPRTRAGGARRAARSPRRASSSSISEYSLSFSPDIRANFAAVTST